MYGIKQTNVWCVIYDVWRWHMMYDVWCWHMMCDVWCMTRQKTTKHSQSIERAMTQKESLIHTYTHTYIHIHIHTHTYTYTYIHIHIYLLETHDLCIVKNVSKSEISAQKSFSMLCKFESWKRNTNVVFYICIPYQSSVTYIHTYTHTYIYTYTHTYVHTYIHTHPYIHAYVRNRNLKIQ